MTKSDNFYQALQEWYEDLEGKEIILIQEKKINDVTMSQTYLVKDNKKIEVAKVKIDPVFKLIKVNIDYSARDLNNLEEFINAILRVGYEKGFDEGHTWGYTEGVNYGKIAGMSYAFKMEKELKEECDLAVED